MDVWWMPFAFFAVALAYSTVGFGGGSSYIALLAIAGLSHVVIPQTALVCNIVVTLGGVWHYARAGHLDAGRVLPFVALSVPAAYLAGRLDVGERVFFLLLGLSLAAAGTRALLAAGAHGPQRAAPALRRPAWPAGLAVGGALGFLAGLVGIGGGVFLAPVLLLARWADAKQAAAAASVFIVVNSVAGLAGQFAKGVYIDVSVVPLVLAVFAGGQIGSRLGSRRLPLPVLQRLLAALILAVGLRLIWRVV